MFSKVVIFGSSTKCPSYRDVHLTESQIKGVGATLDVCLTELSV